jgi:hypothetical protein
VLGCIAQRLPEIKEEGGENKEDKLRRELGNLAEFFGLGAGFWAENGG